MTEKLTAVIEKLEKTRDLSDEELKALLSCEDEGVQKRLAERALLVKKNVYGDDIYIRGLIEFTNVCKNDCLYCGIRKSNKNAERYRLTREQILSCCKEGYFLGFRTFVLQGGEDPYFDDEKLIKLISDIKTAFPDCALTLSIGEKSRDSFKAYFDAGADRYLLRHETACPEHYRAIHPPELSFDNRIRCLYDLKEIGYQVGCGMMIGSPFQTYDHLIRDLRFIRDFRPHMVGLGPFIPHKDTPFKDKPAGSLSLTLRVLSIVRLMHPHALLPATTALGTIAPDGRERGILAGANVVMPNLSPTEVREKYKLYDNKICTGHEAAECIECLKNRMKKAGAVIVTSRGDYKE